jgi:hypothetical protein
VKFQTTILFQLYLESMSYAHGYLKLEKNEMWFIIVWFNFFKVFIRKFRILEVELGWNTMEGDGFKGK